MITEREAKILAEKKEEVLAAWQRFAENNKSNPLSDINQAGVARIKTLGFPHKTHEIFTYVDTKKISGSFFAPDRGEKEIEEAATPEAELRQSVVAISEKGLDDKATDATAHYGEVSVMELGKAVSESEIKKHIQNAVSDENDVFAAMNSAFLSGGAQVAIKKGATLKIPLLINITANTKLLPRVMIDIGENSSATIIIRTLGSGALNSMVDIVARQGSGVTIYRYQKGEGDGPKFEKYNVTQRKDSFINFTSVSTGSAFSRGSFDWKLSEPGAKVSFSSLTLTDGEEKAHHYARFYHQAPDCKSEIVWRNIAADKSLVSVDGTVTVEKGAARTDSDQQIKNLMLSGEAKANSKPNLMIYNDDVKCSHGDTVGQVDDDELLYMRSRGIEKSQARAILTRSFANTVAQKIAFPPLADEIALEITARLGG